jgi:hypothetical protein
VVVSLLLALLLVLVLATCAVIATAMAQIFTNTYQKSLDCNAMQLLYHTSPYIAVVSACAVSLVSSLLFLQIDIHRYC